MKMKTDKKRERSIEQESSVPSPVKPTERKKKRKSMDKEKNHSSSTTNAADAVNAAEFKGKLMLLCRSFILGFLKELASADGSLRVAAAERLVTELQEVQNAYDQLYKKEEIENDFKLEAEEDD